MLLRQEIAFHEYWRENTFRNFSIPLQKTLRLCLRIKIL